MIRHVFGPRNAEPARKSAIQWKRFFALVCIVFMALSLARPAAADTEKDRLFDALKHAQTESEAILIENDIWLVWMSEAPSPAIRDKVSEAMARRESYDFEGARIILNDVVAAAPDYAEGWNQRAFILFLQGNYESSLEDLDKALALEPRHFGALSGKGLNLTMLGRVDPAQAALRAAVALHPFLKERHMLIEPKGQDL